MKKVLRNVLYLACLSIAFTSCSKDELDSGSTTTETTKDTTGGDTTGGDTTGGDTTGGDTTGGDTTGGDTTGNTVTEADVMGLKKDYFKVGTTIEEYLNPTKVEISTQRNVFDATSVDEDYITLFSLSEAFTNDYVEITLKGSAFKEGNYSLKTWRLGSTPSATEAVVRVSVAGNLMDAKTTADKLLSIKKDADGLFVIKLAPLVMKNKNSWDDVITDPISFHLAVSNDIITRK